MTDFIKAISDADITFTETVLILGLAYIAFRCFAVFMHRWW